MTRKIRTLKPKKASAARNQTHTEITDQSLGTAESVATAPDSITILLSANGAASKHFYLVDGEVKKRDFNAGMFFGVLVRKVSSLRDLSQVLFAIESNEKAFVIRGAPLSHVDLNKPIPRRKKNFKTPDAGRQWVLIDFDKIDVPTGQDLHRDPGAVIEHLVSLLPAEFRDCSYHYQLSSSAGMGDPKKVSAHVWFWLTEPWTDEKLRTWAKAVKAHVGYKLVDPALFNDVQPHYTAAPTFKDVEDPFPVRSGLVEKGNQAVSIRETNTPELPRAQPDGTFDAGPGFEGWLARIGDHPGGDGFHEPIIRAIASYVSEYGREGTDVEALYKKVSQRVLEANRSKSDNAHIEERASRAHIIPAINGALEKFGDSDLSRRKSRVVEGVAPHYPAGASGSVEDAKQKLDHALRSIVKVFPCK